MLMERPLNLLGEHIWVFSSPLSLGMSVRWTFSTHCELRRALWTHFLIRSALRFTPITWNRQHSRYSQCFKNSLHLVIISFSQYAISGYGRNVQSKFKFARWCPGTIRSRTQHADSHSPVLRLILLHVMKPHWRSYSKFKHICADTGNWFSRTGIGLIGIVHATLLDEFMNVVQKERAKFQVCS